MEKENTDTQHTLNGKVDPTINGIFIEYGDRPRILPVEKKGNLGSYLIPPGGRRDKGETEVDCLVREVREELNGNRVLHPITFYFEVQGTSPIETRPECGRLDIHVRCYRATLSDLNVRISPDEDKLVGFEWLSYRDATSSNYKRRITPVTLEIIDRLHKHHNFG